MTLLVPTSNNAAVVAAPLPSDAVAAQRPTCDSSAPDLLAATAAAVQALSAAAPEDRDAVVWLSEHIATLDRVIYPIAARHLHGTAELRAQQAATHRLALLVRRLHAQVAGDGSAGCEDVQALRRHLLEALCQHTAAERDLLNRLREQLSTNQWSEPTAQYAERLQRGPTRPHPHTPRNGAAGRLAYRLSAFADHVLDVLDSRPVRAVSVTTTRAAA